MAALVHRTSDAQTCVLYPSTSRGRQGEHDRFTQVCDVCSVTHGVQFSALEYIVQHGKHWTRVVQEDVALLLQTLYCCVESRYCTLNCTRLRYGGGSAFRARNSWQGTLLLQKSRLSKTTLRPLQSASNVLASALPTAVMYFFFLHNVRILLLFS